MRRAFLISTALVCLPFGAALAQQTLSPDQVKNSHGHLKHTPSLGQQTPNIPTYYDSQRDKNMPQIAPSVTNNSGVPSIGDIADGQHHHHSGPSIPGLVPGESSGGEHHHESGPELPGTENSGDHAGDSHWDYREPSEPDLPEHEEHEGGSSGDQSASKDKSPSNYNTNGKPPSSEKPDKSTASGGGGSSGNENKSSSDFKQTPDNHQNQSHENTKDDTSGEPPENGDKNDKGRPSPDQDSPSGVTHPGQYMNNGRNTQPGGDPTEDQSTAKGQPDGHLFNTNPNQVRPNGEGSTGGAHGSRVTPIPGNYDPADDAVHGAATPPNIPEHPGTQGR